MHVCTYLSIHFNLWELNPRLFTRASCFNGLITYPNPHLNKLGEAAKGFGWTSHKAPWQMVTIILLSVSVIWRSGWILQFWMIKEQQRVSAFYPSLKRLWLLGHARITASIHTMSPPGSNPGIRSKSSKTPGIYSKARALAACYLPETRAPTYELCNHLGHWWFSTTAVKWRRSTQLTTVQKRGNKGHRESQNELPQSSSSFSWHVKLNGSLSEKTAKNEAVKQADGSGWSSPRNPRMGCFSGKISSLVPAFMQSVVLQWSLLYFSREWTPSWHSTETKRLFIVLIIYSRPKNNILGDRRKITFENKEVELFDSINLLQFCF